jgi:hypothetical protein
MMMTVRVLVIRVVRSDREERDAEVGASLTRLSSSLVRERDCSGM